MTNAKTENINSIKYFCDKFHYSERDAIDLLGKYAAMLVLLAAAHVYSLADTAATSWQQLQDSRLYPAGAF